MIYIVHVLKDDKKKICFIHSYLNQHQYLIKM